MPNCNSVASSVTLQAWPSGGLVSGASGAGYRHGEGLAIAFNARLHAAQAGDSYAFKAAPTSPYPNLSGNFMPGVTKLSWLKNHNKCNQFVGDVLTLSGFRMPTTYQPGGKEHFVIAEDLPKKTKYFERITSIEQLRPGDLMVIDNLARSGASTAHVEIVTACSSDGKVLESTGAHRDGAYTEARPGFWSNLRYDASGQCWRKPGSAIYLLRPKLRLE